MLNGVDQGSFSIEFPILLLSNEDAMQQSRKGKGLSQDNKIAILNWPSTAKISKRRL